MTLLVRNEEDLLAANLDYHLAQGIDHVIVTDHGSTDGTPDVLQAYERRGLVTSFREEGDEHHQSIRVTRMARHAFRTLHADWVINNDADEFWWPLAGSLRDVFAAIPSEYGVVTAPRYNYLPRPCGDGPFHARLIYREARSITPSGGELAAKVAHRGHPDIVVAPGNHAVSGPDLRDVPGVELLEVMHFPMRSYEQFERKVIQVGTGYEKLPDRSTGVGRDQLELLELYRRGELRGYYDDLSLADAAIEAALQQGSVILDLRLADFMRNCARSPVGPLRPDGQRARAFIARVLAERLALEQLLVRIDDKDAELARLQAALDALRSSRLFRASTPLRRIWYRVKASRI